MLRAGLIKRIGSGSVYPGYRWVCVFAQGGSRGARRNEQGGCAGIADACSSLQPAELWENRSLEVFRPAGC